MKGMNTLKCSSGVAIIQLGKMIILQCGLCFMKSVVVLNIKTSL